MDRCLSQYRGYQCCLTAHQGGEFPHTSLSYTWTDGEADADWMDSGRSVVWAYQRLAEATTIGEQTSAYHALSDAVNDLSSWIAEFDYEIGLDSINGGVEE